MSRLRAIAAGWLATGRRAIVVEVAEVRGSVPRETGTRMLVAEQQLAGTIGGGHLELKAIAQARTLLAGAPDVPGTARFPLGPALGQCCGGIVNLHFAPLDAAALQAWPVTPPRFELQLYGAGHVGRAIVRALAALPVRVDWIDEREEEFPTQWSDADPAWPGHICKVCVEPVEAEVRNAAAGAYYLVLTHRHDLDLRISEEILRRGDFGFFGLIGSRTKRQRFIHRFERRGISADVIERMTCPIGVPGITGKEPEVIAAAVVAQLLQASSAAPARPLSAGALHGRADEALVRHG